MPEPVVALTASAIAALAFQKFIESGAGELAKKFTEAAIAKMEDLRKKIVARLKGKSEKLDDALVKVETGDRAALDTVTKYLDVAMEDYPEFAEEIKILAGEIHAGKLQDNSNMVQNVSGNNNMNVQAKAEQGGKQFIAEKMYFGSSEPD